MLIALHDPTLQEVSAFFGYFGGGDEPSPSDLAYRVEAGAAVFEVRGALVQHRRRGGRLDCTAYPEIIAAIRKAEADSTVDRVVIDIASPGGMVDGIVEAAAAIRGCSKPVTAHCSGLTASAAVWLISGARIVAAPQANYGSIGVVQYTVDASEADGKFGVRRITVRSQQTPNKAPAAGSDEHLAQQQVLVNAGAELFLDWLRQTREGFAPTEATRGGVVPATAALQAGLIDHIGLFAEALTPQEIGMTDEERIKELEEQNAELERQLEEAKKAEEDADDDAQAGGDDDDLEARVAAATQKATAAIQAKYEADLAGVRREALEAKAGQEFAELLAARKVQTGEKPRFMRDHRMAHAPGATEEDKAILAEYAAREPFAPAGRTSHGASQADKAANPLDPTRVQAVADEKYGGDFARAAAAIAAQL